jgi:hypothetical protein
VRAPQTKTPGDELGALFCWRWSSRLLGALPLPVGERVGVRGPRAFDRPQPLTRIACAIRPLPMGEVNLACGARSPLTRRAFARHPLPQGERGRK